MPIADLITLNSNIIAGKIYNNTIINIYKQNIKINICIKNNTKIYSIYINILMGNS